MQNLNSFSKNGGYYVSNAQVSRPILKRSETLLTSNAENVSSVRQLNSVSCSGVRVSAYPRKTYSSLSVSTETCPTVSFLPWAGGWNWKSSTQCRNYKIYPEISSATSSSASTYKMLSIREYEKRTLHVSNDMQEECVCVVNNTYSKIIENDKSEDEDSSTYVYLKSPYPKPFNVTEFIKVKSNVKEPKSAVRKEEAVNTKLFFNTEKSHNKETKKIEQFKENQEKEKVLLKNLLQKVIAYMKKIYPTLSKEKRVALLQLSHQSNVTVFDQLKWFGYDCLTGNEDEDDISMSEEIKNSLAMDLLENTFVCYGIIQSCNMNLINSNRSRMAYTKNFKLNR